MTVQHSAITDPNIHEPKGVAAASSGDIYVADGSGSGDWANKNTLFPTPSYGVRYLWGNSTATSMPDSDTWYAVAGDWAAGVLRNFTSGTGFLVEVAGDYLVNVHFTAEQAGGSTEEYKIGPFSTVDFPSQQLLFSLATGVPKSLSFSTIVTYAVGDTTNLRVKNTTNDNKGLTVTDYSLSLQLLRNT